MSFLSGQSMPVTLPNLAFNRLKKTAASNKWLIAARSKYPGTWPPELANPKKYNHYLLEKLKNNPPRLEKYIRAILNRVRTDDNFEVDIAELTTNFSQEDKALLENYLRSQKTLDKINLELSKTESLLDFWRELLSEKNLDIHLPETPLLNQKLFENLAELETLVVYCCPAFGINKSGGYDLSDSNLYDDIGKAGLFIIETLKSMQASLKALSSLKNITIVMPVNEVKINKNGRNLQSLESTAIKVCQELQSIFAELKIGYKISDDIYASKPIMQNVGMVNTTLDIDTLSLKIQSVYQDIANLNPILKLKFDSMISSELVDGNILEEAEKELFCYVAEQILLAQKFEKSKTVILNTENYRTPALAQEILEQILSDKNWKKRVFNNLESNFLPVLIAQKNRFKINTKSLWQQRNSQ